MSKRGKLFVAMLLTAILITTFFAIQRSVRTNPLDKSQANQSSLYSQPIPKQGNTAQEQSVEKPARAAFIVLQGKPHGGEIRVWVKGKDLQIRSAPNDSTRQLAQKIAEVINATQELHTYGISARAYGDEVAVTVSEYWLFLCTTDTGLRVPPAPQNLRAKRRESNLVDLTWQVPKGEYDSVYVLRGTLPIGDDMDGSATSFSDYLNAEETQVYYVFGVKGRMPSCAASVVVSPK